MLRNDRSLEFAERFVEQWLRTRELGARQSARREAVPGLRRRRGAAVRHPLQPILFFQRDAATETCRC